MIGAFEAGQQSVSIFWIVKTTTGDDRPQTAGFALENAMPGKSV